MTKRLFLCKTYAIFLLLFNIVCPVSLFSNDLSNNSYHFIPGFNYEYNHFADRNYHAFGLGVGIINGEQSPVYTGNRNSLSVILRERLYLFDNNLTGSPKAYHYIDMTIDKKINRHLILGIFNSASNAPLYGGLHTFKTGLGYGYQLIQKNTMSLTLGGGLGVGDFGIHLSDGTVWPVIPAPIIRFNIDSKWIDLAFEFILQPNLNIVIAPEKRIRFTSSFSISQFRGIEDFFFDCSLWYRLFSSDFILGDFAGLGIGIKNSGVGFSLSEREKTYELSGYSIFGTLDLSVLQIMGGYNFKSREVFNSDIFKDIGKGYFLTIQGSYQF